MATPHRKRGRPIEIDDVVLLRVRVPRAVAEKIDALATDQLCDRSAVMREALERITCRS